MKNRLTIGSATLGDEAITGGVTYAIDINGGTELTAGVAACGTVNFSIIAAENPLTVGTAFTWSRRQIEDGSYTDMGEFTVTSVTRQKQKYTIEASDGMAKFDVPVDAWLDSLTYPTTHTALLNALCGYVGVKLSSTSSLTNGDRVLASSPAWEGATGRDILSFLAEASGCFARMLADGTLYVGWYTQTDIALTRANYTGPFVADYTVAAIDKVQVRSSQNDIGVIAGDGENVYIIENNPLFYAESDADLRPYVERLLEKLSALTYTPCEVPLYNDCGLRPGDIFTIDGARAVVMTLRCTESGTVVACTGSETRPTQSTATNRDIIALRGKTNELTRTVEETRSELADAEGNLSVLSQTVAGFETRIEDAEGQVTTLSATVSGLSTRVSNSEGDIASLELTASGLSSRISSAEGNISTLEQTAATISARVGQNEVAISNIGIQLTGYVTFANLSTAGQTVINGGNITTGTISAITLSGCRFVSSSSSGVFTMTLDNAELIFSSLGTSVGGMYVADNGRFFVSALSGYTLTLQGSPQVYYNSGFYDIIHAGNIANYITSVPAVFG